MLIEERATSTDAVALPGLPTGGPPAPGTPEALAKIPGPRPNGSPAIGRGYPPTVAPVAAPRRASGPIRTELLSVKDLSPAERDEVAAFTRHVIGAGDGRVRPFALPADGYRWSEPMWSVLVKAEGHVVSHAGLLLRTIRVGEEYIVVAGIGGIMTLPAYRERGYARAAVEKAVTFAKEGLFVPFALMLCPAGTELASGLSDWQAGDGAIVCEQAGDPEPLPREVAVMRPLGARTWPAGAIDLCGYPW